MSIRNATDEEIKKWDKLVADNPDGGNVLQGSSFIEQKQASGWCAIFLMFEDDSTKIAISVLEKKLLAFGKIWYIPKGPNVASKLELDKVLNELISFAKSQSIVSIKIEPELDCSTDMTELIEKYGLNKTRPIQYNFATVLVDLSPSIEEIMKALPQKGRHAINRAKRDGVVVKKVSANDENCQIMYDLFQETAEGAGFSIRPPEYYKTFYRSYGDDGGLFLAYFEDKPVAGAFAMVLGQKSMYKDGASIRQRTAYGASHLLQWEVIQWAKQQGSLEHDLAGAPPIARTHDKSHPLYNVGRFKRQFNKNVTEYVGAYNIAVATWRGWTWHRFLESVFLRLHFRLRHQAWY
ncbi:FemAB family protein [Candidatus Saccharibacteria bacterium]|nr:MAG: FemAB family protein [Candidatus Saccharibacteria bacterium]